MNRRDLILLALLWSAFLIRGFFYAAVLPVWEGYDEPYHFAYIQHLVASHTTPTLTTRVSRQVDATLHVLPVPRLLKSQAIPKPLYTHDEFWKLTPTERDDLQSQFRTIPREWATQPSTEPVQNYEAQQPPLYYVLCWPLMLMLRNATLEAQIFTLRFAGVLLASLAIPLAYAFLKRITGTSNVAFSILGLAVVMPELYINLARVSNEVPATVIYTALLYVLVSFLEEPRQLTMVAASGILVGLGLLTKAYFLTSVPALLFVIVFAWWSEHLDSRRLLLYLLVAGSLLVIVAGPWYFHVHQLTGSWSGLQRETIAPHSTRDLMANVPHVNWLSGVLSIIISHIWFGAWSFLKVGRSWYLGFGSIFLITLLGIAVLCSRIRAANGETRMTISPNSFFVVICMYGFFCLGLVYDVLLTYVSLGVSSSTGWYIYCLIVAETTLLYSGLEALLPPRLFRWAMPMLISGFAALDVYGMHFLLMPYYTGVISHNTRDQVSAAKMTNLMHFGPGNLIQHLIMNKPAPLTVVVLSAMWLFYIIATVCVPVLNWGLNGTYPGPHSSCAIQSNRE